MFRRGRWMEVVFVVAAVLAVTCGTADAQTRPFRATGAGVVDWSPLAGPSPHSADGTATFLGRYSSVGVVQIDLIIDESHALFSSTVPVVFTAANGDELHLDYAGLITLTPAGGGLVTAVWDAVFTPVLGSSTGRFARVIGGSIRFIAHSDVPFHPVTGTDIGYRWVGTGSLTFGHP